MLSFSTFSTILEPGKRTRVVPVSDFRLTSATFSEFKEESGRTTVKFYQAALPESDSDEEVDELEDDDDEEEGKEKDVKFEDEPTIITHLTPGRIETQVLDIVFIGDEPIEFEITGNNPVQLVGNYVEQQPAGYPDGFGPDMDSDDDDEDDSDDEKAYALDEVSSDVEVDPSAVMGLDIDSDDIADAGKIVEVAEEETTIATISKKEKKEKKKEKKRARESDADAAMADIEEPEKESPKEKKKNKKQKTESGAVPTGGEESSKAKSGAPNYNKVEKHTLPSGLTIDVRTVGEGAPAKIGQTLSMRYIGKLQKDMSVFDKNTKGKAFSFKLGAGEVIKGWDEGLVGLKQGAEAILTIPPNLAYGNQRTPKIPPGSALRFEVKVLSIK